MGGAGAKQHSSLLSFDDDDDDEDTREDSYTINLGS